MAQRLPIATMKDSFREAVWEPRDQGGIGLPATTVPGAGRRPARWCG
jgi:hypothetical protein